VNPLLFYTSTGPDDTTQRYGGYPVLNIPTDFVWAFATASPVTNSAYLPRPAYRR